MIIRLLQTFSSVIFHAVMQHCSIDMQNLFVIVMFLVFVLHFHKWRNLLSCILVAELRGDVYWRTPFQRLSDIRQLTRFIVMDTEMISVVDRRHLPGQGHESSKVCNENFDAIAHWWQLSIGVKWWMVC